MTNGQQTGASGAEGARAAGSGSLSPEQIEERLRAQREALAASVDEFASRIDPRTQAKEAGEHLREQASAKADHLREQAAAGAGRLREQAEAGAGRLREGPDAGPSRRRRPGSAPSRATPRHPPNSPRRPPSPEAW